MKVSIIVAAYNEAPTITRLLEQVWAQPIPASAKEIIVVESNSTDGSRPQVERFIESHAGDPARSVRAIYEAGPRGKGHAVRQGIAAASGDVLLIQDADLEYDVRDYPALIGPIVEDRADFVLGSRHLGADRWNIRSFADRSLQSALMNVGGILFHGFFNRVFGVRLSDPTTMYKVFRARCLDGLVLGCNRFDFDYELVGKLIRSGFMPLEVPVAYRSRGFHEGKKIRVLRDPLTWVFAILKCRFAELRPASRAALGEAAAYRENPARHASS
jgi:glycosyltransferase involved in cell wall biosynthesis